MKLVSLAYFVIILLSSRAFAFEDHLAQAPEAVAVAQTNSVANSDQVLRDSISKYANDEEAEKTSYWQTSVCGGDGIYKIGAFIIRGSDPERAEFVDSIRTSMHKYLVLAHKSTQAAVDQIWQEWHDIPAAEKTEFAKELATDCFLARTMLAKNYHNCYVNEQVVPFDALNSVCLKIAPDAHLVKMH